MDMDELEDVLVSLDILPFDDGVDSLLLIVEIDDRDEYDDNDDSDDDDDDEDAPFSINACVH
jgi:hypothetical protein